MVYVPATLVSTVLIAVMLAAILPSKLSVAVVPASVYVAPWFTETCDVPTSVITGASVSNTIRGANSRYNRIFIFKYIKLYKQGE